MENIAWNVSPCPLPQEQVSSSSRKVTVSLYGTRLEAKHSLVDRVRSGLFQWRRKLRTVCVAGAAVALGVRGPHRLVGLAVCAVSAAAWRASKPVQAVPNKMEAYVADMVGAGDSTTIGGRVADELLDAEDRLLTGTATEWIRKARLHFGELKDTAADRICAKRWLAEEMKRADMRDKDACGLIPVVVEMLFVPSIDEVLAVRLRRSRVAGVMKAMAGGKSV